MSLKSAVKKTVEYASNFGGELTKEEAGERLLSSNIYKITNIKGNFKKNNLNIFYSEKLKKARDLSENNLARFKDIKLIAVTGSVASGYPKKNDDIDLLVVTGNNRLWLTRFKVRIYVALNGVPHRKWNEKHEEDKFCFNLWLDEETIKIARDKRNLQNAVDLILMKPILNRDKTYEKMLLANDWVKKYVATGYDKKTKSLKSKSLKSKEKTNYIDKVINWLVFWPQYWYMKGKIKKETVDPKRAYFHPEG